METKLFSERVKIENCVVESTSYQGKPDQDLALSVSWSKNCAQALRARGQPRLNYLNITLRTLWESYITDTTRLS